MIVECIDDTFYTKDGRKSLTHPIKGCLYEVIEIIYASSLRFYGLKEFGPKDFYDSRQFKEVEIDISDVESAKLNELPIEVLI